MAREGGREGEEEEEREEGRKKEESGRWDEKKEGRKVIQNLGLRELKSWFGTNVGGLPGQKRRRQP